MKAKHTLNDGTELFRGDKHRNGSLLDGARHLADPFPKRLTPAEKRSATKLTGSERKRWQKALNIIGKGWNTFIEVGLTLKEIKESRLYREEYDSWEKFCREVVGVSKTEANRQIIDAEVVTSLQAPIGVTIEGGEALPLPENRAQARALARVKDPGERREIWQQVVAKSESAPVSAQVIEEMIEPSRSGKTRHPERFVELPPKETADCSASENVIAGLNVLETLIMAHSDADWTLVDAVITYLEEQPEYPRNTLPPPPHSKT